MVRFRLKFTALRALNAFGPLQPSQEKMQLTCNNTVTQTHQRLQINTVSLFKAVIPQTITI